MKASTPSSLEPLEARIAPAGLANIDVAALDGTTGFKLSGPTNSGIGASVSAAGDVNGDGFADVIVSAPGASGDAADSGASYVLFGKAGGFTPNFDLTTLNGTNGFKISGIATYDQAGSSVSAAGDVNGDGFADLIVGATPYDPDTPRAGTAYVIFGKASGFAANIDLAALNGTDGFKISGAALSDRFGAAVSGAGDVNGDGFADVIVGASRTASNGADSGASYVIFGKATGFAANFDISTLNGANGFKISGVAAGDSLGYAVSAAGDVNGDGFGDLIVGALNADPHGDGSGASYVIFGKASGFTANFDPSTLNGTNGFKINGVAAHEGSGLSVSSAGDVNGDGFADLLVGAIHQSPTGRGVGAAYVVYGKASGFTARLNLSALDGTNGFKISSGASNLAVGGSVSGAGDVNGDGFDDVIVNAIHYTSSSAYYSTSYVLYGKAAGIPANVNLTTLTKASGFQIGAPSQHSELHFAVSSAGDVNGDGVADLILGGGPPDNTNTAGAYVVFGKATSSTYTYLDTDGDRVKIVASQGVIDPHGLKFSDSGKGRQLDLLDLTGGSLAGANLTIKATPRLVNGVTVGDGHVNIGEIDATGINLGTVAIAGDLTAFHAGDGTGTGVLTLTANSLGKNAALFPTLTPAFDVAGRVGQLTVTHNVTNEDIAIGTADAHGVGIAQIGGSLMGSTLSVGTKLGQLTVGGSLVNSTVRAAGTPLPATTAAAVAIGTLTVTGSVQGSSILAGYDAAGNPVNGNAGIGTVTIVGNFAASNIVAGVEDSTHDGFGQNDTLIPGSDSILATIAKLIVKGTVTGSPAAGDFFGITAAFFGAAKIHGTTLALTNQPTSYFPLDPVNQDLRLTVV